VRVLFVILMVLAIVPSWTGEERLALFGPDPHIRVSRVALDPDDPARTRVGRLEYLGGIRLQSSDPAFGGFSSLSVVGDRFVLLSDGGNYVRFRMGADWQPRGVGFGALPAGPGHGWEKGDRDTESMAVDPATGTIWVGYESHNAIWRYAADFARAEARVEPPAMAKWPTNGGPESLARLPDGRFVTISEDAHARPRFWAGGESERLHTREGLIFAGDPTAAPAPARFAYEPFGRYDPSDAAALPNGDLLVLDRAFTLPFRFSNRLSLVRAADLKPGGVARGRLLATLDAPLIHDNFEGLAVVREGGATILWLVSDDNQLPLQRSLLLKFRLVD